MRNSGSGNQTADGYATYCVILKLSRVLPSENMEFLVTLSFCIFSSICSIWLPAWGWRDDSALRSTGSSGRLGFESQHPHDTSHLDVTPVSRDLMPF